MINDDDNGRKEDFVAKKVLQNYVIVEPNRGEVRNNHFCDLDNILSAKFFNVSISLSRHTSLHCISFFVFQLVFELFNCNYLVIPYY